MLVVGGDQATILAHLQAGGVRGAEPFAGVTLVPVDQAALAQRVLSRPLAAPAGTQADREAQRAPAAASLPRTRTAAELAPAAARAPTTGGSTAAPSAVGASAPRTEGRHGSPTSAAASQPVPVLEMQRDGTLMVKGDPIQLQERLRQGGVERVLRRKGGVLVGLDQVGKARQLLGGLTMLHQAEASSLQRATAAATVMPMDAFKNQPSPTMDSDPLEATPERPAMVLCGGVVEHPYRAGPPLSWESDLPGEWSQPATKGPTRGFCGGVEEHPYRVGPSLSWDLESPSASSFPAAKPSSVNG